MAVTFTATETFLLTRPSRDVTEMNRAAVIVTRISTHTPLAGRDGYCLSYGFQRGISTHTPLAGRDCPGYRGYSHAYQFLLTRPSRDVTGVPGAF